MDAQTDVQHGNLHLGTLVWRSQPPRLPDKNQYGVDIEKHREFERSWWGIRVLRKPAVSKRGSIGGLINGSDQLTWIVVTGWLCPPDALIESCQRSYSALKPAFDFMSRSSR